jgi:hypothetical protein
MAICIQCDLEFPTVKELDKHIKSGHKIKPSDWKPPIKRITLDDIEKKKEKSVEKKVIKEEKPKPIELTYKYIGQCPECRGEVDTIMMEVGKSTRAIAYCVNCRKKLSEKKVKSLE